MIIDSNTAHFHEVQSELLGWLLVQISNNERVRLDVGNKLFLLL